VSAATYRYIRGSRMARSATVPTERPSNDATGESAARPHLQLDLLEALKRREAGQDLAMDWANTEYKERLSNSIKVLAASGETFCSDDIRLLAGDPPEGQSPNLVGALVNHALRSGLIHTVGYTRSARVVGHANTVLLFRGRRS